MTDGMVNGAITLMNMFRLLFQKILCPPPPFSPSYMQQQKVGITRNAREPIQLSILPVGGKSRFVEVKSTLVGVKSTLVGVKSTLVGVKSTLSKLSRPLVGVGVEFCRVELRIRQ